jgi:RNA-directed DNA polymerase
MRTVQRSRFSAPVKAGKVLRMKVSYGEGLATHTDSESCIFVGKGEGEALTGVRAGQVWSREIEPPSYSDGHFVVSTLLNGGGRQNWRRRNGETLLDLARSETLSMHASALSGSRESPWLSVREETTDRIGKSKDARTDPLYLRSRRTRPSLRLRRRWREGGWPRGRRPERKMTRTLSRQSMSSALERIRQAGTRDRSEWYYHS